MKILMINKFLFPNGGSETYIFKLGAELIRQGHEVQYFGMEHEGNIVGNHVNAYTTNMDFHNGSFFSKLTYPVKTIYSREARKKIRMVLDDFMPDVCHLNNFNYQLTPSIILEIKKWTKESGHKCKIVYTAHDYQLICPNHMCFDNDRKAACDACTLDGFKHCALKKCIHGSMVKSIVGMLEAYFWNKSNVYSNIDHIICCSEFMKKKLDTNPVFEKKTIAIHNFIEKSDTKSYHKKNYVLYFGRYSQEKGIQTLLNACQRLKNIDFVFAGTGSMEKELESQINIQNVGFKKGEELQKLVAEAVFTVYPSEWYENCPLSIMESISLKTPVLGADIGGIPELIRQGVTGELYHSGDVEDLISKIQYMHKAIRNDNGYRIEETKEFYMAEEYVRKLFDESIYCQEIV